MSDVVRDRPESEWRSARSYGRPGRQSRFTQRRTGRFELTGNPRVQQGLNTHVATSPDTVMIYESKTGQLETHGPSRTEIRQDPNASKRRTTPSQTPVLRDLASSVIRQSHDYQTARSTAKVGSLATTKRNTVLVTDQLVKIYGGRAVVNGIDIKVRAGEIVGLLGPNGAGKTTSFYMIVGLVRPNSGRVIFSGTT